MHSPNDITVNHNQITYNDDGEPVIVVNGFEVECYVDFATSNLKFQKDGENVVCKFIIFITIQAEIEKFLSINKENMPQYSILYNTLEYSILNIEKGIKHLQIFI